MNILFLTKHFEAGGITSYLLTLGAGLVANGNKVVICSSGGSCVSLAEEKGIIHISSIFLKSKSIMNPSMWLALPKLKALIKDHDIEIVHAQTRVTQVLAAYLNTKINIPYISTCHGFFKPHYWRRRFSCWGANVIAISVPVQQHLLHDFNLRSDKVKLIPNGIDLRQFSPITESRKKEIRDQWNLLHVPVIGIIARLSEVKGHEYLIKAVQLIRHKYPHVKCIIAGEGPLEGKLKKQVKSLALEENIQFYKVVNNAQELLPLFDVFVLPSLNEGLGLSVMEAQAHALPVVVSNVGGLPDLVEDGVTGMLVSPGNVTGLAKSICSLLDNKDYASSLGQNAHAFIKNNFSSKKMVEDTYKVYQQVIS